MIGQIIAHYRILSQIGEGGMGVVYLAEDVNLGRRVAIKVPTTTGDDDGYFRARFLREARSVSAINHPNIAAVYDYGEMEGGRPYIVMEWVQGRALNDLLTSDALTLKKAVRIVRQTAEALAAAHARGVIHRDIKPSNVMLNEQGQVKVLDFGLAKQLNEEYGAGAADAQARAWTKTRSDVVIGTPLYLSPEQARSLPVDARSDLFSLGALLYECIAGRPAFAGSNLIEIGAEVLKTNPPPPSRFNSRVPPELDRITLKALSKRPEERYQNATEMAAELEAIEVRLPETDMVLRRRMPSQTASQVTIRQSALMTLSDTLRRPRLSLASVLGAIAITLVGVWAFARWREPRPHQPLPAAESAYERGAEAMRDGAYFRASGEFEAAVRADQMFALAHAGLAEALSELDFGERAKDELLTVSGLVPERSALPRLQAFYLEGITATAMRDFGRAVESYREIVRLEPNKPQAYVDLGRAYERNDEVSKAIESYIAATNRDARYATPYLRLGILYARNQDLASAAPAFEKAEKLYEAAGNNEGRAEVFYQRGSFFYTTRKLSDAQREFERALELARANQNRHQQIRTLAKLSGVLAAQGNMVEAERDGREAVELAQANGMETLRARALVELGNAFIIGGKYVEAEKYIKQAIELAQRYKAKREEALAVFTLGSARIQQRMTDEAVRYLEQARDFYQQRGYRKEAAQAFLLLGRAFRQKGEYAAALSAGEEQLRLAERVGDQSLIAQAHVEVGNMLAHQEEYGRALAHFNESYAIYKSLDNKLQVGYSLLNRSGMLWRFGRYREAEELLAQATSIAESPEVKNKSLLAALRADESLMELSRRRFDEVKRKSQQTIELAGTQRDAGVDARRALCLSQIFAGELREGLQACDEALMIADALGDPLLISSVRLARAQALLANQQTREALSSALEAQANFARGAQLDSEWLAWLVAAEASARLGEREAARQQREHAEAVLGQLRQRWSSDDFNAYLTRPDVQSYRKRLGNVPSG